MPLVSGNFVSEFLSACSDERGMFCKGIFRSRSRTRTSAELYCEFSYFFSTCLNGSRLGFMLA